MVILSRALSNVGVTVGKENAATSSKWNKLFDEYRNSTKVNQMIFVKYKGKSKADLYMYEKKNKKWNCTLKCKAYVGKNGLYKKKEGDKKTPSGRYNFTMAFGIKKNPGSKIKYTKLNSNHYWCEDKKYYNQFIDVKKKKHKCTGEHLISYKPEYNYALALNYNAKNTYNKGSAIFLHCKRRNMTLGCISVTESNMKKIIKTVDTGAKIFIYKK